MSSILVLLALLALTRAAEIRLRTEEDWRGALPLGPDTYIVDQTLRLGPDSALLELVGVAGTGTLFFFSCTADSTQYASRRCGQFLQCSTAARWARALS